MQEWVTQLAKADAPGATLLERAVRPAIALAAVLLLIVAVIFGFEQNVAGIAAAATSAVFCLIFVFLPRFSEVAILGFKAKLFDQKITEADALLTKLKALTLVVARSAFETATYGNRMTNFPLASRQQLVRDFDTLMNDLGLDRNLIKKERGRLTDFQMFDVGVVVHNAYNRFSHTATPAAAQTAMREAIQQADLQAINRAGSLSFFDKLTSATAAIEFANPQDRAVLLAIIAEGKALCQEISSAGVLTDRAREYLETYATATNQELIDAHRRRLT